MRTVLTYGTFDLFHIGHVRILERARSLGDRLYVGISTDNFNSVKGKKSIIPYEHRSAIVRALTCVDDIFPENDWNQKELDIERFNANVLVMGHDWAGKFDHFKEFCEVNYFPRTEGISTTELKLALSAFRGDKLSELRRALDTVQSVVEQLGE